MRLLETASDWAALRNHSITEEKMQTAVSEIDNNKKTLRKFIPTAAVVK